MASKAPSDTALRVSHLSQTAQNSFSLQPEKETLAQIAQELGFTGLKKVSFAGKIAPHGGKDWRLTGQLGATVTQPCVITLDPVNTRVDVNVTRLYVHDYTDPDDPEAEMPEDDTVEPLGTWIDPGLVMIEALALAAPDYPRKQTAELGQMVYTKPGEIPMSDADARPFAGLAALKGKLNKD